MMQIPQMPAFPAAPNPMSQMAPIGEIVWVQSIEQLSALNLPPNVSRLYMNSAEAEFYIVTTDKIGMKNITTYTFVEKPKAAPVEYVTMSQLDNFKAELINALKEARNEPHNSEKQTHYSETQSRGPGGYPAENQPCTTAANDYPGQGAGYQRG